MIETVNYITSPSLKDFVFVFYRDSEARISARCPKQSDYQPVHHIRQEEVDILIAKYNLPDWKEYKRKLGGKGWHKMGNRYEVSDEGNDGNGRYHFDKRNRW